MLQTTLEATRALFRTDPTVAPSERTRLLSLLRQGPPPEAHATSPAVPSWICTGEVARRLAKSTRTVQRLADAGYLTRRRLPGRKRGAGFLLSDVEALILAGGEVSRV